MDSEICMPYSKLGIMPSFHPPQGFTGHGEEHLFPPAVEDLLKALSKGCSPALRGTGTWTLGHWLLGPRPHCSPGATDRRDR